MLPPALLVFPDDTLRDGVAARANAAGFEAVSARTVGDALRAVRQLGVRPAVVALDDRALRWDAIVWSTAQRTDERLAHAPVVLHVGAATTAARIANVRAVVPFAEGPAALVAALVRVGALPPPPARPARGSARVELRAAMIDLHAYALDTLVQYLGARRAAETMQEITAGLPGQRIVTTADLHAIAGRLRTRGDLEATVATLLSGRATLLDSERTLRET